MGAALAPLLPTASALSVHRTPLQMGKLALPGSRATLRSSSSAPAFLCSWPATGRHCASGSVKATQSTPFLIFVSWSWRTSCAVRACLTPVCSLPPNSQRIAIGGAGRRGSRRQSHQQCGALRDTSEPWVSLTEHSSAPSSAWACTSRLTCTIPTLNSRSHALSSS